MIPKYPPISNTAKNPLTALLAPIIINTVLMATVRHLLETKSSNEIVSISPERTTYDALKLMAEKDIGAVAVIENGKLIGLLTEREYARRIVLEGKKSRNTPVRETMNPEIITVDPDTTVDTCMQLMTVKRRRYIAVIDSGDLIGLVSIGDVVKQVIVQQQTNIENLERYITGSEYGV